jgi:hypothetical protein
MKSKSPSNRSVSSYGFSIVGRPRLVALIVTTVALAAIAFATISLAQTGKPIERSESPAQPATKASLREKATGSGVTSKRPDTTFVPKRVPGARPRFAHFAASAAKGKTP